MPTTRNFEYAWKSLGLNRSDASEALHAAKSAAGLRGDDDCDFDLPSGHILFDGEIIGNLRD